MSRAATSRVSSFLYPQVSPDFDAWVGLCQERRGRQRCHLPAGHSARAGHTYITASYYTWWRAGGQVPDNWMLRPKNGNWDDMERLANLELVPRHEHWHDLYAKAHRRTERGWQHIGGIWHKECTRCGDVRPVEDFPPKRNLCKACWPIVNRRRAAKSRDSHAGEGCVVVNGHHFHVGLLGQKRTPAQREAARVLGCVRYLQEPTGRRPRRA